MHANVINATCTKKRLLIWIVRERDRFDYSPEAWVAYRRIGVWAFGVQGSGFGIQGLGVPACRRVGVWSSEFRILDSVS